LIFKEQRESSARRHNGVMGQDKLQYQLITSESCGVSMKMKLDEAESSGKQGADRETMRQAASRPPASANSTAADIGLQDNRSAAIAQRQLQRSVDQSPYQRAQETRLAGLFGSPLQRVETDEDESLQRQFKQGAPAESMAHAGATGNRTGMPDQLKTGVEALSGMDLSDVRVHRNSAKAAQLNALAYAQGNEIHLGPGQEQHLPHEAWHVVQQRQGRVRPTLQMAGVQVNDEEGLEKEADLMGDRANAVQAVIDENDRPQSSTMPDNDVIQQKALAANKLNVAGESHPESNPRRGKEKEYSVAKTGGVYKTEGEFKTRKWWLSGDDRFGDPMLLRAEMLLAILKEKTVPLVLTPFSEGSVPAGFPETESLESLWGIFKDMLKKQLDEIALALVMASHEKAEQKEAVKAEQAHSALVSLSGGLASSVLKDVKSTIIPEIGNIITTFASDVLGMGDIRPEDTVSALRSSAMQGAAADNAARSIGSQKGVWKVGQEHIAEIALEKKGDNYELLTKDEFNADFEPWLEKNL
jgi:hypothetical protein